MISKLLKKNEKGFTLMEMLIVVAIIAVLVAIAIPTFTSSLNKAKAATDAANIRAGYASVMMTVMDADLKGTPVSGNQTYYLKADGTLATDKTGAYECKANSTDGSFDVAGTKVVWSAGQVVKYEYNATNGTVTITAEAKA